MINGLGHGVADHVNAFDEVFYIWKTFIMSFDNLN